jgi:hypothetical protein
MTELLKAVASWPSLLLVVVVFGFAPGFCLRLIVLAYPRGDPRRDELIAELYAVPRVQRPLWVAEQLEVALFEGLGHRVAAGIRWLTGLRRTRAQTDKRGVPLGLTFWAVLLAVLGGATPMTFVLVTQSEDSGGTWVSVLGAGLAIATALLTVWMLRLRGPPRRRNRRERTE